MVTYQGSSVTIIDEKDSTSPIYEFESFTSITKALQWKHVRVRAPICLRKLLGSRYMLANLVYLIYSIGILIINLHPSFNEKPIDTSQVLSKNLDSPVNINPDVNGYYIGLGVLHLLSASLYLWAWRDRSWFDIVMIPEYLNHIEAGLYLWSAFWYSRQDILGGYYTLAVHKIELVATIIELIASFGWIMSWYMTYTRTLGRGFTLDDPDTIAYLTTTISSLVYVVYNIQINLYPEEYGTNMLYKYSDVLYFIGAWYYIFAGLRDENCFWFLPLAGQYGVAAGRIRVETKELPKYGKSPIFITDLFNVLNEYSSLIAAFNLPCLQSPQSQINPLDKITSSTIGVAAMLDTGAGIFKNTIQIYVHHSIDNGVRMNNAVFIHDLLTQSQLVGYHYVDHSVLHARTFPSFSTYYTTCRHESQVIEIRFRKKSMSTPQPGQYIYFKCFSIAKFEWHPFTGISAAEENCISVHIRIVGNWTSELAKKFEYYPQSIFRLSLDGPYGSPADDVFNYDSVVLIDAGIGGTILEVVFLSFFFCPPFLVTPYAAILKHVRSSQENHIRLRRVYFYWIYNTTSCYE
ncbi:unnamed protein product [Rotaria socialis]|uniref:FAD-binding FR-type domain-containing protein n=1 Tax=Rotaria socialis TaxID=392032 RepID=A0A818P967_9BILA|nr:unnamed protein product [Rotaria socialis]